MSSSSSTSRKVFDVPVPKFATGMFDNYKTCYMKLEPQILHLQEMYRVHRDALDDEVAVEFRRLHNDWLLNAQKKPAGGWWKEMWNKEGHLETKVLWGRVEELRSKIVGGGPVSVSSDEVVSEKSAPTSSPTPVSSQPTKKDEPIISEKHP